MQKNHDETLATIEEHARLVKERFDESQNNPSLKNELSDAYAKLGDAHTGLGNLDKALAHFEHAAKLRKELHEVDKNHVAFKNGLAASYFQLAGIHMQIGKNLNPVQSHLIKAQALWKELTTQSPGHVEYQKNLRVVGKFLDLF